MSGATLRERNKARRRDAIVEAAIALFAGRGYHETTIPDIADLAQVSPRTVSMHFPAKLDIVRADIEESASNFRATFAARPPDSDVVDTCIVWIREWLLGDEPRTRNRLRMYVANEELGSLFADRLMEIVDEVVREDPELRQALDRDDDRQIVGAALGGVVRHLATLTDRDALDRDFARIRRFFAGGVAALRADSHEE